MLICFLGLPLIVSPVLHKPGHRVVLPEPNLQFVHPVLELLFTQSLFWETFWWVYLNLWHGVTVLLLALVYCTIYYWKYNYVCAAISIVGCSCTTTQSIVLYNVPQEIHLHIHVLYNIPHKLLLLSNVLVLACVSSWCHLPSVSSELVIVSLALCGLHLNWTSVDCVCDLLCSPLSSPRLPLHHPRGV